MRERHVEIATPDGRMDTFVTHPDGAGPCSGVIVYMDVWGVREELYDIARRIATVGYYCMVPDLYYRFGRISHEFRDEHGRMISLEALDDARRQQVRAPMLRLTDDMVVRDTAAMLAFMDGGEPVIQGSVGAIGYCMGGRHVIRAAGAYPDRFKASASLHGTRLVVDASDSPHHSALKAAGELYCGFAEHDPFSPMSTVKTLAECLTQPSLKYTYEVHLGTEHGYALPDRDIFHKQASNRDWELIFAMFRRQLAFPGSR